MPFFNPYQFVPVSAPNTTDWSGIAVFDGQDIGHHSHASYATTNGPNSDPVYSGRLICRLETVTQAFVGGPNRTEGDKENDRPATVEPYKIDNEAAIPASTLRGMISSVAESASNSALRVLENRFLTYRRKMSEAMSAIGMVILAHGKYWLYPLTLPTGRITAGTCEIDKKWSGVFCTPRLKVYLSWEPSAAWSKLQPTFVWASRRTHQQYYALPLEDRRFDNQRNCPPGTRFSCDDFVRRPSKSASLFIGQRPLQEIIPVVVSKLSQEQRKMGGAYRQGVLRVFAHKLRTDIPQNRTHELFIPFSKRDLSRIEEFIGCDPHEVTAFTIPDYSAPTLQWFLEIPHDVVARYHALADERSEKGQEKLSPEEQLPYQPVGTPRNEGDCDNRDIPHSLRLKSGDLIYFDVANTDVSPSVAEVSFSSIWRGAVKERAHAFFCNISRELLPFNALRRYISPAEWLFGFVEVNEGKDLMNRSARAFAGKVNLSPARLLSAPQGGPFEDEVTLKVLSSPKPPCPAMYFAAQASTAKSELTAETHNPNGRKFYLHAWQQNGEVVKLNSKGSRDANVREPWRSHDSPTGPKRHLKVRVKPVKKGCVFYFHVDFDNLSATELDLLCFALQPNSLFHHKLGMGKPIGLGTVRVNIEGLFLVNRLVRYGSDDVFDRSRYHQVWWGGHHSAEWRSRYRLEMVAATGQPTIAQQEQPEQRAARYLEQHTGSTTHVLLALGNPQNIRDPVHYPQLANLDVEVETFKWFVYNDRPQTRPKQRLHWNGTGDPPPLER
ncbi:MAG: TIGR03986 family type III CRISPR-associated RAMP protein [Gammaproteobacteria bacterium]